MWFIVGGIIGGILVLLISFGVWINREERKHLEMESTYRQWKIAADHDPTYDEYGRPRK